MYREIELTEEMEKEFEEDWEEDRDEFDDDSLCEKEDSLCGWSVVVCDRW